MSRNTASGSGGVTEPTGHTTKEQKAGLLARAVALLKAAKAKLVRKKPPAVELSP
jgi:hypothetical protein